MLFRSRLQPTWLAGRLIITPHAAYYSPDAVHDMRHKGAVLVRDVLTGTGVRNCVNAAQLGSFSRPAPQP